MSRKPSSKLGAPEALAPSDIRIDYAANDSCEIRCWCRGHVPPEAFRTACEQALHAWDGRRVSLSDAPITLDTWRTVRAPAELASYGVCDYIHVESAPGRGAYPVTVLNDWLPLHADELASGPDDEQR